MRTETSERFVSGSYKVFVLKGLSSGLNKLNRTLVLGGDVEDEEVGPGSTCEDVLVRTL